MIRETIITELKSVLNAQGVICFGYLHGSFLSSDEYHNIDIALYIKKEGDNQRLRNLEFDFVIPLAMDLEKKVTSPVDLQILNNAPLAFRYSVLKKNEVLVDRDPVLREDFERLSLFDYFDYKRHIHDYVKEALRCA